MTTRNPRPLRAMMVVLAACGAAALLVESLEHLSWRAYEVPSPRPPVPSPLSAVAGPLSQGPDGRPWTWDLGPGTLDLGRGTLAGGGAAPFRVYLTDDAPEVAAVRAADRFRAAGWTTLPTPPPGAAPRHLLAFRSGDAVCWLLAEPDPRTGRTRCVLAGP